MDDLKHLPRAIRAIHFFAHEGGWGLEGALIITLALVRTWTGRAGGWTPRPGDNDAP